MKTIHSLVSYLSNREIGNSLFSRKQSTWQHDAASVLAEEKATSPTKNMACELSGRSRSTFLITFSPNGQFIGSTHGDHAVRVTDVTSGKCLHILKGHPRTPWSIAFHPISNNLLASGCLAGHVRIWDLHGGGSEVWKTPKNTVVTSLTFHPAGQVLLIATSNNILFWDWSEPQPFAQCATRSVYEKVRWVQFDSLGHFLYTGISNTTSVQGEETEETSTTECDSSLRRGDGHQLRDRYQMIVEQITSMQRVGALSGTMSDWHVMSRRQSDSQTDPPDSGQVDAPATGGRPSTSEDVESDGDDEFLHQSPEHSQSLEDATNYASLVTLATRAAMITRLGTSSSMTRQSTSAGHGTTDDVSSDPQSVTDHSSVSFPPTVGVWSTLGSTSTVQDPRSGSSRQRSTVPSEDAPRSDGGVHRGGADSGSMRCTTSVPSAPLQCNETVSSSSTGCVVTSTDAPQTDFPQCSVLSRPAVGRRANEETPDSACTRRVSRMVLPPVLGNCAPSTTVESHFSPVHMPSCNTHSSDNAAATSVSDDTSESHHHCTVSEESRQPSDLPSVQATSLGFNPHGGSASTEQTPPVMTGESESVRTRPRLVVRAPRVNASIGASDVGGSSSSSTTLSQSERATVWRSRREQGGEEVDQDGAAMELPGLHTVDELASRQSDTADVSSDSHHRCTVLGESRRSTAFSSVHARSLGSHSHGGSTSSEQTPPITMGESESMRTRPRLVVRLPRTNISTGAPPGGRSSSNITARGTARWSRREQGGEEVEQDGAGTEWPGLHRIDLSANRQSDTGEAGANWSVHRRWSGALQQRVWTMRRELARRRLERRETQRRWHMSPRHHLHPHYSVSILDGNNRSNNGLQAAINRAIAGAFTARGEASVASNIDNLTHRIQRWDISSRFQMPDIDNSDVNVVVSHCKMHNDTSCDISKDGTLLTTFVPSHHGFPDDTILGVFSLCPETLGQCMFTKSFGPNAISVSLSPLNNYVLVGLAARRLAWVFAQQMVGQVYRLKTAVAGEDSMQTSCDFQHVCDLMHPCDTDMQSHVSVNTACWLPGVGQGIAYATNKGDLHICTPGCDETSEKAGSSSSSHEFNSVRQNLMQMLGLTVPRRMHYSSLGRQRQTTGSQTDPSYDHSD